MTKTKRQVFLLCVFFTLFPKYTSAEDLIVNGSFEFISTWGTIGNFFYSTSGLPYPRTGAGYAYLSLLSDGTHGNNLDGELYQDLTIPANSTSATLSFWYNITTDESPTAQAFDTLGIFIYDFQTSSWAQLYTLSNQDSSTAGSYQQISFNLNSYIGKTIRLNFWGQTDSTLITTFRLDDVSIIAQEPQTCSTRPDADTNSPTNITQTSITANGDCDPNGCETDCWFQWGFSAGSMNTEIGRTSVGSGNSEVPISANITGLSCGTTIYYEAYAENDAGSDNDGDYEIVTTSPCTFSLSNETPFCDQGEPAPGPAVQLNWSARSGASFYRVYRDGVQIGSDTSGLTFLNNALNIVPGNTYSYFVQAFDSGGGFLQQTNTINVTFPADVCLSPGSITLTNEPPYCDTSPPPIGPAVKLNWTAHADAHHYDLHRDGTLIAAADDLTGLSFINEIEIEPGFTYDYKIEGFTEFDVLVGDSTELSVFIPADICDLDFPGPFTASIAEPFCDRVEPEGPAVRIYWTESEHADYYDLYRDGVIYPNGEGIVGNTFLNNLNLSEGEMYEYFVRAHNALGYEDSEILQVTIPGQICDTPSFPDLNPDPEDGRLNGGNNSTPVCGNDLLEIGEECDNGASNGACPLECSSSCTLNSCTVNNPPIANNETYFTDQDVQISVPAPGVLENDTDLDGDTITASLASSTTDGVLNLNSDGSFVYTPNPGFSGSDSFTYTATDGIDPSNTAVVTLIVRSNDPNVFSDGFESGDTSEWSNSAP